MNNLEFVDNSVVFKVSCKPAVAVSHSLTVSSSEPDASSWPSGGKATEQTQFEWPSRVCNSALLFCSPVGTGISNEEAPARTLCQSLRFEVQILVPRCLISYQAIFQNKACSIMQKIRYHRILVALYLLV